VNVQVSKAIRREGEEVKRRMDKVEAYHTMYWTYMIKYGEGSVEGCLMRRVVVVVAVAVVVVVIMYVLVWDNYVVTW